MAVLLEVLVNFNGRGHWGKMGLSLLCCGVFLFVYFVSFF